MKKDRLKRYVEAKLYIAEMDAEIKGHKIRDIRIPYFVAHGLIED